MAIFGKKKRETLSIPSATQTQSTLRVDQCLQVPPAVSSKSSWNLVQQRPRTSDGSPPYQPAVGKESPAPTAPCKHRKASHSLSKLNLASVTNVLAGGEPEYIPGHQLFSQGLPSYQAATSNYEDASLYDLVSSQFDAVVTLIDGNRFSGDERDLALSESYQSAWQQEEAGSNTRELPKVKSRAATTNSNHALEITSANYFSKANLYANSRLPQDLPPMKLYLETFPLLCLAARYSERAYEKPSGQEKETHIGADWKAGTKAMVIKSVPMDDMNAIVFAVRGSQTFMDWAVNLHSTPISPEGFLDDPENFCHAGFLSVARKMITPVAARLRHLIEESPDRCSYSLLITGHSAGGAVAALLYSHMLSTSRGAGSELNILTGCFKRVHCVTFGAPPVSIFPLAKPKNPALNKSLFYSFVNEGDPVARADKAYVRSLLTLYITPAPTTSYVDSSNSGNLQPVLSGVGWKSSSSLSVNKIRPKPKKSNSAPMPTAAPRWKVPDIILSNAGRLILLRGVERKGGQPNRKKQLQERMDEGVVAQMVTDEHLRGVIWGDPISHMMKLYLRRLEVLATNAVTARGK